MVQCSKHATPPAIHGRPHHRPAGARSKRRTQPTALRATVLTCRRLGNQPHPLSGRGGRSPLAGWRPLRLVSGGGPLPSGHPAAVPWGPNPTDLSGLAPATACFWRRAPALRASRRGAVGPQPHGSQRAGARYGLFLAAGPCPPGIPPRCRGAPTPRISAGWRPLRLVSGGGPLPSGHPAAVPWGPNPTDLSGLAPATACFWRRAPALRASRRGA